MIYHRRDSPGMTLVIESIEAILYLASMISEPSIATTRPPLRDVTHRVLNETGTSHSLSELQTNQHIGAQGQSFHQTVAAPVETVPEEPIPSTSKGKCLFRYLQFTTFLNFYPLFL